MVCVGRLPQYRKTNNPPSMVIWGHTNAILLALTVVQNEIFIWFVQV